LWVVVALVAVVGLGATGLWLAGPGARPASSAAVVPEAAIQSAISVQEAFTAVAEALKPSVVNISTRRMDKSQSAMPKDLLDRLREFFGPDFQPPQQEQYGLGSGVIIDPEGYILTNRHVVANADEVEVSLSDERKFPAKVLAADQYTDLAVLKIEASKLKAATLGDATQAKVGSWAIAFGSPFGWEGTVTVGVVSAKNRQIQIPGMEGRSYRNLIQTDAAINPGNSGGPLVNIRGEVIGINQQIASQIAQSAGLGFAIPIDEQNKKTIESLKGGKVPERGLLGVAIDEVTPAIAAEYDVKDGAFVTQVVPGQAGEKAGIKEQDVITRFGDTPVHKPDDLVGAVTRTQPGTKVNLTLVRNGKEMTLPVTVGRLEAAQPLAVTRAKAKLGLTVSPLSDALIQKYDLGDLGDRKGVVVTNVDSAGEAARATPRLREGDVILYINRKPTGSLDAYEKVIAALKPGGHAVIMAWRQGHIFASSVERIGE
jgi:Do/DeqQ family serine protease